MQPPIFIIGNMHSGTTLLQRILGRHPAIYVSAGETRHFSNLQVTRGRFPDLHNRSTLRNYLAYLIQVLCRGYESVNFLDGFREDDAWLVECDLSEDEFARLLELASGQTDHNALFVLAYSFMARKAGKQRWLDKLPGYVAQFDQMRRAVPEAKFIELVRDPRDILVSKKKRVARGRSFDPLWDTLGWQSSVRAGSFARHQFPEQVLRVRYEDLVSDPLATVGHICAFLREAFDPAMLEVGWVNTTTQTRADSQKGIGTAAVGKWRRELTPSEIMISQWLARKELSSIGYPQVAVGRGAALHMPVILLRSAGEFFTRLYSRWRLGGAGYLWNVMANYGVRLRRLGRTS